VAGELGGHERAEGRDHRLGAGLLGHDGLRPDGEGGGDRLPPGGDPRARGADQQGQVGRDPGARGQQPDLLLAQAAAVQHGEPVEHVVRRTGQIAGHQCLLGETGVQRSGDPRVTG